MKRTWELPGGLQPVAFCIDRHTSVNCGADVRMRIDVKIPIHDGQTLFHADEANSSAFLYGFTIKAGSRIPYTEANLIRRSPQAHYEASYAAVFCRIVESFLQDPE